MIKLAFFSLLLEHFAMHVLNTAQQKKQNFIKTDLLEKKDFLLMKCVFQTFIPLSYVHSHIACS